MSLSQETWERAAVAALLAFAGSVGAFALLALALNLAQLAANTAAAIAAAGPGGIGITLALRKKG